MAKTVKIPLVMANGEKATDMKSLIDNFDISSVVGYFLDGKLKKWLNDRYYEDEAEAISQLDRDDPALAQKLCDIFCIMYEESEVIDAKELARRNERIARLKQITDDEEILKKIDSVAFNQEELAELYDKGIEHIILCDGIFSIPKSKQNYEYTLVGQAYAEGLTPTFSTCLDSETCNIEDFEVSISDKIVYWHNGKNASINSNFIETDNYVVDRTDSPESYRSQGCFSCFQRVNKITGEYTIIAKANIMQDIDSKEWAVWGDKIVMPRCYKDNTAYIIDLKTFDQKALPIELTQYSYKKGMLNDFYFVALLTEGLLVVDLSSMRSMYILDNNGTPLKVQSFHLDGKQLYVLHSGDGSNFPKYNNYLLTYDLVVHKFIDQLTLPPEPSFDRIYSSHRKIFFYEHPQGYYDRRNCPVYSIDKQYITRGYIISFSFSDHADSWQSPRYVVDNHKMLFVDNDHQLCMCYFRDGKIVKLLDNCDETENCQTDSPVKKQERYTNINHFTSLGNYIYFENGMSVFRINIFDRSVNEVIL